MPIPIAAPVERVAAFPESSSSTLPPALAPTVGATVLVSPLSVGLVLAMLVLVLVVVLDACVVVLASGRVMLK